METNCADKFGKTKQKQTNQNSRQERKEKRKAKNNNKNKNNINNKVKKKSDMKMEGLLVGTKLLVSRSFFLTDIFQFSLSLVIRIK